MAKINVRINGKDIEIDGNSTILSLLEQRNVTGTMFVVEQNLEIIPKDKYQSIYVKENDSFEIVGFFGGG